MARSKRHVMAIGITLALLVAGGVWWKMANTSVQEYDYAESVEAPGRGVVGTAGSDTDPFDVMIEYTNDGYVPAEMTIKKGQRVRFLNTSDQSTWPASGIHPTHTLYPEKQPTDCLGSAFDSCAELPKGQFFDFTFNHVGEWRYHDHTHAYDVGTVIVQ